MADLVIKIREYIGESSWNWYTDEYEWATNTEDLRLAVDYANYMGQAYDRIVLEIGNCYGGYVDEGLAMFHYLQGLDVPVHTRILGTVASMGTIIPLAGDTIEAAQTSQWMVHAPSNEFGGTAAEIRAGLKYLDGDTQALAAVYAARTGADEATIAQWFTQDTWFTADEALAAGLCTQVNPLRPKSAPAAPATEAQARQYRQRFAQAVARADKRTPSPAKTPAAAAAAPTPAPKPAPMATTTAPKPKPRAAAPAPKPTAKPAQARKTLFTKLMEALGIEEDGEETAETTAEAATAAVESTELDNGAFLYHDGALAQGTLVFNDEALTEATADGDYDTADGQVVSVAAGAVTALAAAEATATTTEGEPTATAALAKRLDRLEASLKEEQGKSAALAAENTRLKGVKPPMPQARAARADGAQALNPKEAPSVKQPIDGAGIL
jgi:ATP-dependent protease ClpP protease subunit